MKYLLNPRRLLLIVSFFVLLAGLSPLAPERNVAASMNTENTAAVPHTTPPMMLKDINTANVSSDPYFLLDFGSKFFFFAVDPEHGQELWVSDGTLAGTTMVQDITPDTDNTHFYDYEVFNGKFSSSQATTCMQRMAQRRIPPSFTIRILRMTTHI